MDDAKYENKQKSDFEAYEARCLRCGLCCGLKSEACAHLVRQSDGKYNCAIYQDRFGLRQTVGGRYFLCIPIRDLVVDAIPPECAYRR